MATASRHLCCPRCRLRFAPALSSYLPACPECGLPPAPASLERLIGFRLFEPLELEMLPEALAVPLPDPWPDGARS